MGKLTAALDGLGLAVPSPRALRDLRRRPGSAPFRALFEMLAGPLGQQSTPGARFGRYRTVAFDGCKSVKVPDTARNRGWLGKLNASRGETGYPVIQLMTLVETGTRALIGAVFGTPADGELARARKLLGLLDETMLVLMDRGFDAGEFLRQVAATRAQFLVRLTATRRPPILRHLPDGSVLSLIGGVKVRVITASVTVTCHDGTRYGGTHRLATTLLDHRAWPADALIALYHERWEHEIAYLALRHTLLQGCCARATRPAWSRRCGPSSLSTRRCGSPSLTPCRPSPAPTRSGQLPDRRPDRPDAGHRRPQHHQRHRGPGRRHRPRGAGQPARATPAPRLRPQGQIPAEPLEQAPARQAHRDPDSRQDHHRDRPGSPAASNTPPAALDTDDWPLTPRH